MRFRLNASALAIATGLLIVSPIQGQSSSPTLPPTKTPAKQATPRDAKPSNNVLAARVNTQTPPDQAGDQVVVAEPAAL